MQLMAVYTRIFILLNIFSKFKHVSILYSADGIEDTFEYVRYPGVWETYKENIIKRKRIPEIEYFGLLG